MLRPVLPAGAGIAVCGRRHGRPRHPWQRGPSAYKGRVYPRLRVPRSHEPPQVQAHPAQAFGRGADGEPAVWHRYRFRRSPGRRSEGGKGYRRRTVPRDRRWQHLSRHGRGRQGHGPGAGRLHGHAGHGDERPGDAVLAREAGRPHARPVRHTDGRGVRAGDPPSRRTPPGKGPCGDLRRRGGRALFHHRQRRGVARGRNAVRRIAQGHQRRWRVQCRSEEGSRGKAL